MAVTVHENAALAGVEKCGCATSGTTATSTLIASTTPSPRRLPARRRRAVLRQASVELNTRGGDRKRLRVLIADTV